MNPSSKLGRLFIRFLHQLLQLKKSLFDFLLCLPTSVLALLLLILLAYNGFSIFCIHVPFFPKTAPEHANFLLPPAAYTGKSLNKWSPFSSSSSYQSTSKLTSSVLYAVKEENPSQIRKTHLPFLHKSHYPKRACCKSATRGSRRIRKHKRRLRSLPSDAVDESFSTRIRDFLAANSSSPCNLKFFMTWISSLNRFGEREILAIQSLFKSNPNACLVIISNSMDSPKGRQILSPFHSNGYRVISISPDFNYIFRNTNAEQWYNRLKRGHVDPGEVSLGQNLSNLLRLSLLYKFGGIYIDTDFIVLKDFSNLRNVIGAQTIDLQTGNWSRLNNAVLIFDKNHPILFKFIQEFTLTFNGNKWGHNGPYLVSRVVSRLSGRSGFDFTVLPPSSFYPVDWSRIRSLFQGPKDGIHSKWLIGKLRQIRSRSFAVHLWNRQSRKMEIEKGSIVDLLRWSRCLFCNNSASSS